MNLTPQQAEQLVTGWGNQDYYLTYHVGIARAVGVTESIILSKAIALHAYWKKENELNEHDEFFCCVDTMEEHTGIKEGAQRRAIKALANLGLLKTKQKGLPARRYFKLNFMEILNFMEQVQNKNRQNGGTDNGAVCEDEKPQKPHNGGNLQNDRTRNAETTELEPSKRRSIIKDFIIKDFEKEEEEEKDPLLSFLVAQGHETKDAEKYVERLKSEQLEKVDQQDILKALNMSLVDFANGKCDQPYIWAAGKLRFLLKGKAAAAEAAKQPQPAQKPKQPRKYGKQQPTREEVMPEWFEQHKQEEAARGQQPAAQDMDADFLARKAALEAELANRKQPNSDI